MLLCKCRLCKIDLTDTATLPDRPFAKVSVDLIVELPATHSGNKNIVMVDHLSGWPLANAIPDKDASTVANAIHEKLILEYTCPDSSI